MGGQSSVISEKPQSPSFFPEWPAPEFAMRLPGEVHKCIDPRCFNLTDRELYCSECDGQAEELARVYAAKLARKQQIADYEEALRVRSQWHGSQRPRGRQLGAWLELWDHLRRVDWIAVAILTFMAIAVSICAFDFGKAFAEWWMSGCK